MGGRFADERVVYNEVVGFRLVIINGEDDEVDIGIGRIVG